MHHPDLRYHARDRIVAAGVMKLDLAEAEPHAARGEPSVIAARKPWRAAPSHTKPALACASRRSPTLRRVRRGGQAPEDAALYLCRCGRKFTAAVTTCVACPTCGTGQPW
jgi:hypothetical protein